MLFLDSAIALFSVLFAYLLTGESILFKHPLESAFFSLLITAIFIVSFLVFKTYRGIIRYSSFVDLLNVFYVDLIASGFSMFVCFVFYRTGIMASAVLSWKAFLFIALFTTFFMWCMRVVVQYLYDLFRTKTASKPAFVYGVKSGGIAVAKSIKNADPMEYSLRGFVDPDNSGIEMLEDVYVYKDNESIVPLMNGLGVKYLIVSPARIDTFRSRKKLVSDLIDNNIRIIFIRNAEEWDNTADIKTNSFKEVNVLDLLPRKKIEVDMEAIGELLSGKKILITGAAGSIGSEMVRQIAGFGPAMMILIDQAETPMHDLRLMLAGEYPQTKVFSIVAPITNQALMEKLFKEYSPDYVFHAAAYKHVPMMEDNPAMAVQNNIRGTRIIADLSVKYGVDKFVMISTDKAVNPTNVMGCSKRICEIYCQSLNHAIEAGQVEGKTHFVTTRFGNVLGSNGSVIPIFREQIRRGGPVTVTHPDIVRFFMLIPEACKLVLEAGTMGNGGEIFVFDMGDPVKIVDLAKRMIKLSGADDVEIKFSGLRDGEKLYEEVLSDMEGTKPTIHPKIKIAKACEHDYAKVSADEERLFKESQSFDDMAIVRIMKEIVPEYKSACSKYEVLDKKS